MGEPREYENQVFQIRLRQVMTSFNTSLNMPGQRGMYAAPQARKCRTEHQLRKRKVTSRRLRHPLCTKYMQPLCQGLVARRLRPQATAETELLNWRVDELLNC
jgi:hypothetical protein